MFKKELIANILEYIHNNFKYKITITDLANLFNYNHSYIINNIIIKYNTTFI